MSTSFIRRNLLVTLCALTLILAACAGGEDGQVATGDGDPAATLQPAERGEEIETPQGDPVLAGDPSTPRGLTVVGTTEGSIDLVWDESRDADVTRYRVLRTATGGASTSFDVQGSSFSDGGLEEGDVFSYRVVALRGDAESAPSESVVARVGIDTNAPRRPGRPLVEETPGGQILTWIPTQDVSGIATYVLTREVDGDVTTIDVGSEPIYRDDLPAGTVVTYSVRAVDGVENVSEPSRSTTLLTGTPSDRVAVVVSAQADPANNAGTARFERELLDAGFTISWFEDGVFDSNVTNSDDIVILLGDVVGEGFDWNVFVSDATVIGLKAPFVSAGGFSDVALKLDRIQTIAYDSPTAEQRFIPITVTSEPKPVVIIPPNEQIPDLDVWATPDFSAELAIAGIIPAGGELANGREAVGCRAFYPGNTDAFAEMSEAGWNVLIEFIGDVEAAC